MMRLAAALLVVPAVVADVTFDEYLRQFGKSYGGKEYDRRRALFEERVAQHASLNSRPGKLWTAGLNELTDQFPDEIRRQFGYSKAMRRGGEGALPALTRSSMAAADSVGLSRRPPAVDWRKKLGVLSPVKAQGGCGSCWAFAAAEAIESNIAINTGVLTSLSPQQLTSCVQNPNECGGSGGCTGATPELAFEYVVKEGLSDIWHYPYLSGTSMESEVCNNRSSAQAFLTGYEKLPANDADALEEAVAKGPVAVSVDASAWYMYQKGIFDGCDKANPDINHAVLLVGYGHFQNTKYWIIQNSWGPKWGEDGFIRLKRYDQEPCGTDPNPLMGFACAADGANQTIRACGECGVLSDSSRPTGGSLTRYPPSGDAEAAAGTPSGGGRRLRAGAVNLV